MSLYSVLTCSQTAGLPENEPGFPLIDIIILSPALSRSLGEKKIVIKPESDTSALALDIPSSDIAASASTLIFVVALS
jgi:hypothetical protein